MLHQMCVHLRQFIALVPLEGGVLALYGLSLLHLSSGVTGLFIYHCHTLDLHTVSGVG